MSCTTAPPQKWEEPIAPGAARRYELDAAWAFARRWESKDWESGDTIRLLNGYDAECTYPGRSGPVEPRWSSVLATVVLDGSARWTIVAPSASSLVDDADEFEWDVPEGGFTVGGEDDTATRSSRIITVDDDVQPGDYEFMVAAIVGAEEILKVPCILQVR